MAATLSLTESQTLTALRSFLLAILPAGIEVVKGQTNRVPEPAGSNFLVMTPILRERIETNTDSVVDLAFTASIAGQTMTVTALSIGRIAVGSALFGPGIAAGTIVTALGTGTGGVGTYTVAPSQTLPSGLVAGGTSANLQPVKVTVQLDVHGPAAADNAQIITTLFRDQNASSLFAAAGFDVTPLYTGEPRQMPFENGEQQVETRWSIDAVMQANPVVTTSQDFAAALNIGLIEVDATYHP